MTSPEVESLADALDRTRRLFTTYVAFPTAAAADAVTLWTAHTHAVAAFESTPRLHLSSPEPGSGKTRTLEVLAQLVYDPLPAANATVAALFRSIGDGRPPTVILDEVDTIFGPKAPDGSEDLRGLINAGHRRGQPMLRCVGPSHDVQKFETFAPMVLAGLGSVPDTVEDRSVRINMRRRAPGETVRPFRQREADVETITIREWLADLTDQILDRLDGWYPELPDWLTDRPADVWEPLIAIADLAGGSWGHRARDAASVLIAEGGNREASLNVRLLGEIREVFKDDTSITTDELLTRLHQLEEAPWGEWGLTARKLAGRLSEFGIRSKNVRIGDRQAKGYERAAFADAWQRYLSGGPSQPSQASDLGLSDSRSVPETDPSVPASQTRAPDQGWDGGTDGTDGPTGVAVVFDDDLIGG